MSAFAERELHRLPAVRGRLSAMALMSVAIAAACAPVNKAAIGPGERELTFSIQGLVCGDCGKELEEAALRETDVKKARFDATHAELSLVVDGEGDPARIIAALEAHPIDGAPIHAVLGGGMGSYAPFEALDPRWDAKILSANGDDVGDLEDAVRLGKVTVIDFYADWCGPCHEVDRHMHALLAEDGSLAYRRINIVSWETPVAKHHLRRVEALPYVVVFDRQGREVARISGLDLPALDAAIRSGESR